MNATVGDIKAVTGLSKNNKFVHIRSVAASQTVIGVTINLWMRTE